MSQIESDKEKCINSPNPDACKHKINIELDKWKSKYEEHLVKLSKSRGKKFPYFEKIKNAKL